MSIEQNRTLEREQFIGLTTLECARKILLNHPEVRQVHLRPYFYIPEKDTKEPTIPFLTQEFLKGAREVQDLIQGLREGWNVALDSFVIDKKGKALHFIMMDLHLPKSPENLGKVTQRLKEVVVPEFGGGFILETGKSYHFLGKKLLTQEKMIRFLGKCLLTSIVTIGQNGPKIHEMVVDYRYVGHALGRGSTGLRITANGAKNFLPRVVRMI